MDEKRIRFLRRAFQLTASLPGEPVSKLAKGEAYTMVYKYIRGNTNFLSPSDDDPYHTTAAPHILVCHFVLDAVYANDTFTVLHMVDPEVYGCTHEDDVARMRIFLELSKNTFEFPSSTWGRDVRLFKRGELESAIKID